MKRFFGTDGLRGLFGTPPLTLQQLPLIGAGLASFLPQPASLVIGYDTRISSLPILEALQEGLSCVNVLLCGLAPTPAVAYMTRCSEALMGLVISASHNPYPYNGLKFFNAEGEKLESEEENLLEKSLFQPSVPHPTSSLTFLDLDPYKQGLWSLAPKLRGLKVVLDCAHGAFVNIGPEVFRACGAEVLYVLGGTPTGTNINEGVGSVYPEALQKAVVQYEADLGIAFDGDGDRVLLVDELGQLHDGDQLLAALCSVFPTEGIVGTVMSNCGLQHFLQQKGISFVRSDVGDRFVAQEMKKRDWTLGGESCGHLIIAPHLKTGDGCAAALCIAALLKDRDLKASQLFPVFQPVPHKIYNVPITSCRQTLCASPSLAEIQEEICDALKGKGRLLVRPSGTEPLVRILLESPEIEEVEPSIERLIAYLEELDRKAQ